MLQLCAALVARLPCGTSFAGDMARLGWMRENAGAESRSMHFYGHLRVLRCAAREYFGTKKKHRRFAGIRK